MLDRRAAAAAMLIVLVLATAACGGSETNRAGAGVPATANTDPDALLRTAVLDPSCTPRVETFTPTQYTSLQSPLATLTQFLIHYNRGRLEAATLQQAVAPGARRVPGPLPPTQRFWVIEVDRHQRIVLVIHTVAGGEGWYVHDLHQCGPANGSAATTNTSPGESSTSSSTSSTVPPTQVQLQAMLLPLSYFPKTWGAAAIPPAGTAAGLPQLCPGYPDTATDIRASELFEDPAGTPAFAEELLVPTTDPHLSGLVAALDTCHQITIDDQGHQDQATLAPIPFDDIGTYSRGFQISFTSVSGYKVYDIFVLAQIDGVIAQISYETVGAPGTALLAQYAGDADVRIDHP